MVKVWGSAGPAELEDEEAMVATVADFMCGCAASCVGSVGCVSSPVKVHEVMMKSLGNLRVEVSRR